MKRLPQGVWRDTLLDKKLVVVYYDSRARAYRVEYLNTDGLRNWAPVEEFGESKRYRSMGVWGLLLRPIVKAEDFCFAD